MVKACNLILKENNMGDLFSKATFALTLSAFALSAAPAIADNLTASEHLSYSQGEKLIGAGQNQTNQIAHA